MIRFLRFTVETALDGRGAELKEYVLGVEVFDRKPSYDPRIEPIVRVEARRLRSRIKKYYETEGRDDPVRIEFSTGRYAPDFRRPEEKAPPAVPTVAVLPFSNLSADPDNEYFSDGLTEELIHALTRLERLRVVAWPSAHQFKGKPHDIRQIGEQLEVGSVLEGSVRRAGDRLRVTAQLVDVRSGVYIWSETYERQVEDVFAIQEEIARKIADTLLLHLAVTPGERLGHGKPASLEAYYLYLKGRYEWNKRTVEGLQQSIECFERAIQVDGGYAAAWAGLADAYAILGGYGVAPPRELMPKAKQAAQRALDLDETLSEAHASLALVLSDYEHRWEESRLHYRRAIELKPGYATARHWIAIEYLASHGRLDEALAEIRRAQQLDPLSLVIRMAAALILEMQGRFDLAIEQQLDILRVDPNYYRALLGLARAYVGCGRSAEGIDILERLAGSSPFSITLSVLGHAYAVTDRLDRAEQIIERLGEQAGRAYVSPFAFARVYLGFPQKDLAFEWLEKAYGERDARILHIKVAPIFHCLRGDPRYDALLGKMGLA
ncbi:MAG: hypothetical protein HYR60_29535 [Acidobacteria bacterium]|nr:hypothetical protein [Acidobacteriota bacterium]